MLKILWKASPFYCERGNNPLDMIVIHHIGSQKGKLYGIGGTITWFTDVIVHKNPTTGAIDNQVSAHYAIPREPHPDYDVVQFVKDTDVAYHAGTSQWVIDGKTRKFINQYSIGIELEGDGNLCEYTDFQYDTLITLTKDLISKFRIPENNIVGHEDIAPSRKVDPGKLFDWKRFRSGINPPSQIPPALVQPATTSSEAPAPVLTTPAAPGNIPDKDFHMAGGTNKDGRRPGFFAVLFKMLLSIFSKS